MHKFQIKCFKIPREKNTNIALKNVLKIAQIAMENYSFFI